MKLMKKIIPLITIASTAAIVAPMVTSCAYSNFANILKYDYTYEPILLQPESPEASTPAQQTIENGYFNVLKNKPEIFADEIYSGLKNLVFYTLIADYKYRFDQLLTHVYDIKHDSEKKTIDFTLDIKAQMTVPNYESERRISDYKVNGRTVIQFKNLSMNVVQYWIFAGEHIESEVKTEGAIIRLNFTDDTVINVQESDEYFEVNNATTECFAYNAKFTKDNLLNNLALNYGAISWLLKDLRMEQSPSEETGERPSWIYYSHLLSAFNPNEPGWDLEN